MMWVYPIVASVTAGSAIEREEYVAAVFLITLSAFWSYAAYRYTIQRSINFSFSFDGIKTFLEKAESGDQGVSRLTIEASEKKNV